jgi:hypothetical protein
MSKSSRQSVMKHQFSEVPKAEIQRSSFDRSHGFKTTFDAGNLIPCLVDEVLPGDTFNVNMTGFARLATPIHPIMDNMFLDTHFFAVPVRLLWDNWEKFNGARANPDDSVDYTVPTLTGTHTEGSLGDYFGIPTDVNLTTSAMWHRAYNLIWNEWFRDENLQDSITNPVNDGPDTLSDFPVQRRGKRHDYFTSCLPWPQKGDSVDLPLGTTAPIAFDGNLGNSNPLGVVASDTSSDVKIAVDQTYAYALGTSPSNMLYADLSDATAATINQLRLAFQTQKLLERDARGGTRYIEVIKAHFGVTSPDARLQRPEYLGGGSTPINITPVAQTSSTDATTPQANLSAMGTALTQNHGFTKSFTEHSVIIGLISARADLTYQQGLNRMFSRSTRYDFFWPALSHIGEQAVLNKEIYADGTAADDNVFGYQERYAEYRYKPSTITGKFRSNYAQTLDSWHLSQDFASLPTLGSDFIEDNPPIDRVIAVSSEPHFIFDAYFNMKCARPMPVNSVPGMIDHF